MLPGGRLRRRPRAPRLNAVHGARGGGHRHPRRGPPWTACRWPSPPSGGDRFAPGEKAISLSEALRQVPGLYVAERNNPSQGPRLMARGLGARAAFGVRGVKVLLDGVPLTTPDGQTQLGNIDLAAAGRVEVLRGPNSSLYGNAGGGVVSVRTEHPEAAGLRVKPRLVAGSDGLWLRQATLTGGGRHSWHLSARQLDLDGYRDHSEARGARAERGGALAPAPVVGAGVGAQPLRRAVPAQPEFPDPGGTRATGRASPADSSSGRGPPSRRARARAGSPCATPAAESGPS